MTANTEQTNLRFALDAYANSVAVNRSVHWRSKLANLSMYAAAAGSALALSTSAEASIIYSGEKDITIQPIAPGRGTYFANINLDGQGNEFRIVARYNWGSYGSASGRVAFRPLAGAQVLGTGIDVRRLQSGAVISSGVAGFAASHWVLRGRGVNEVFYPYTHFRTHAVGAWPDRSNTGFAGLKFIEAGQPHFGWIRLKFHEGGVLTGNVPDGITAIDWAYNDVAGGSIQAGQTSSGTGVPGTRSLARAQPAGSPTPEPGTGILMLLAAGCTGLKALRARRKQIASNGSNPAA